MTFLRRRGLGDHWYHSFSGEMKAAAESAAALQSQIDSLTKEKARLERVIANGSADAETVKDLKQAKADLASITNQYKELFERTNNMQAEHDREMFNIRVDNALQIASGGLKFKAGLPEAVTRVLLQQASEKMLKGLLTHDGCQQDMRTHDIGTLVNECRSKCDAHRIEIPAEISDNVDEIIGLYHRDVKCLPSDEVVSRVHDVLPAFLMSCCEYCGEVVC